VVLFALVTGLVSLPGMASAECGFKIEVWPPADAPIPTNAHFVLTASSAALFGDISDYRPRLRHARGQVPLVPETRARGPALIGAQVVLIPAWPLRPRTEYTLELDCEHCFQAEKPTWTTGLGPDRASPRWLLPPRPLGFWKNDQTFPCDDEYAYFFDAPVFDDEGPVMVRVELHRKNAFEASSSMLLDADGQVAIGHDYCGAGFALEPGPVYLVYMTAMDSAGNLAVVAGPHEFGLPAHSTLTDGQLKALRAERKTMLRAHRSAAESSARERDPDSSWPVAKLAVVAVLPLLLAWLTAGRVRRRRRATGRLGRFAQPR